MIPLIPVDNLHEKFSDVVVDVSQIPVTRRHGNGAECDGQFWMIEKDKFHIHMSGAYFLKGKGPNQEGYRMLPPFENNPEEYGTKCFPWISRKVKSKKGDKRVPVKLSKRKSGYPECRFQITTERLKELDMEDKIRRRLLPAGKTHNRPQHWTDIGMQINCSVHTMIGYALFPQYFQTKRPEWVLNHKAENHDYRLSQLSLIKWKDNYLKENLQNFEDEWIRELMGRKRFSMGGLVGQ